MLNFSELYTRLSRCGWPHAYQETISVDIIDGQVLAYLFTRDRSHVILMFCFLDAHAYHTCCPITRVHFVIAASENKITTILYSAK